jgi:hypothetical protein
MYGMYGSLRGVGVWETAYERYTYTYIYMPLTLGGLHCTCRSCRLPTRFRFMILNSLNPKPPTRTAEKDSDSGSRR